MRQRERDENRESTLEERLLAHLTTLHRIPVSPERGSWWPPPRSHVSARIIKRAASVCPHHFPSILFYDIYLFLFSFVFGIHNRCLISKDKFLNQPQQTNIVKIQFI